jgi:hypothetical protein
MNGQIPAVPHASRATDVNKALYIKLNFSSEVSFDLILFINNAAELANLFLRKIFNPDIGANFSSG